MVAEILGNEPMCKDFAARLIHAEEMITALKEALENPNLSEEDKLRYEGMLKFWEEYAAKIREQIELHCK